MDAYIYQADLVCGDCFPGLCEEIIANDGHFDPNDSYHWPQGPYRNGGGEADYPCHCYYCGQFLQNALTTEGEDYVRQRIEQHKATGAGAAEVLKEWEKFYDYLKPKPEDV